ncbi:MAG: hypothetical protein GY830_04975 [Bacteroidetes bacterium]|nr:hypothetical protein [Bacteroidota bacterium]
MKKIAFFFLILIAIPSKVLSKDQHLKSITKELKYFYLAKEFSSVLPSNKVSKILIINGGKFNRME